MGLGLDSIFGVHADALKVRSARAEILASNIANADTPGYKAQDLDFKSALAEAKLKSTGGTNLTATNSRHIDVNNGFDGGTIKFRESYQPDTGDGNTVDINIERMAYMENGLEYQTTLEFLNGRINTLRSVLAGEQELGYESL